MGLVATESCVGARPIFADFVQKLMGPLKPCLLRKSQNLANQENLTLTSILHPSKLTDAVLLGYSIMLNTTLCPAERCFVV